MNLRDRGIALFLVLSIIVALTIIGFAAHFLFRSGKRQIIYVKERIMLFNTAESILNKVLCQLKKYSWEDRWYKTTHKTQKSSEEEMGVFLEELGHDKTGRISYYFFIEDVIVKSIHHGSIIKEKIKEQIIKESFLGTTKLSLIICSFILKEKIKEQIIN